MADKWAKVGKSKARSSPVKKTTKPDQQNVNLAAVAEFADPLAPSETSFGSFAEIQERREHQNDSECAGSARGKKPRRRHERAREVKKEVTLEEALQQVDVNNLAAQLEDSRVRFTAYPIVWLKDVADNLHSQLAVVHAESDPLLSGKASNYPLSEVGDDMCALLSEMYDELELDTVRQFYRNLLCLLVEYSEQDVQTYAIRILLQALLFTQTDVFSRKLQEEIPGILKKNVGHSKCFLTLLWALGQMPNGSWSLSLKMWIHCILPLVFESTNRPLQSEIQQHIIQHFSTIVSAMKDDSKSDKLAVVKNVAAAIDVQQFVVLQQAIFENKQLTPKLHEEFLQVYPDLKAFVFSSQPKNQFRNSFPYLLSTLEKTKSDYQAEVLSCLVDCLCEDEHCLILWRQMQLKRLKQSMILIEYLKKRWSEVKWKMPREALQETVRHILVITEDNDKETEHGRQAALFIQDQLCKNAVLPAQSFAWTLKATILIIIILCIIDIVIRKGFKDSFVWNLLDSYGLLVILQAGLHSTWNAMLTASSWLGYHIPLFTSVVIDKCWPFGTQFLRLIEPYWAALSLQGSNFASWIYFNLPQLLTVMRQVISACAQLYVLLSGWASHFWEMLFT
jgi:hypothetical protein